MKRLKFAYTGYIVISILFYIMGAVCIISGRLSPRGASIAGGIILIVYGIIKIIGYLSKDLYCLAFQYDLACGMFLIVLGIVDLVMGSRFIGQLMSGMGILILLDSLLCVQIAIDAKKFGMSFWYIILAASILSGALGVVLAVTNMQTVAGCALLAEGFLRQYIIHYTVQLP